jgi:hypothetical protein
MRRIPGPGRRPTGLAREEARWRSRRRAAGGGRRGGFRGLQRRAGAVPAGRGHNRDHGNQLDGLLPVPAADAAGDRRAGRPGAHPGVASRPAAQDPAHAIFRNPVILEAAPGAQVRHRPFTTGQASSRQAAIRASSRSAARRAGTCTVHPAQCNSTSIPASVYSTPNRRQTSSAILASVQH